MVGIILATHGDFAKGILQSGSMIFGDQPNVAACTLQPSMGPEDIKDQQGFPWDQKELRYYGTYYGFPTTLKENAIRAHKYLFGTSDYQVSDELSRINQKIIYRAGY